MIISTCKKKKTLRCWPEKCLGTKEGNKNEKKNEEGYQDELFDV